MIIKQYCLYLKKKNRNEKRLRNKKKTIKRETKDADATLFPTESSVINSVVYLFTCLFIHYRDISEWGASLI